MLSSAPAWLIGKVARATQISVLWSENAQWAPQLNPRGILSFGSVIHNLLAGFTISDIALSKPASAEVHQGNLSLHLPNRHSNRARRAGQGKKQANIVRPS